MLILSKESDFSRVFQDEKNHTSTIINFNLTLSLWNQYDIIVNKNNNLKKINMETKDETQKTILKEVLESLQREKRKIQVVDCFVSLAVVLSLIWMIMEPKAFVVVVIVITYASLYLLSLRSDAFDLSDKRKTLQLLKLAVRKTKTKISSSNSEQKISKYLVNLLTERDRGEVWHFSFILKELLFEIKEKTKKENEWNLLYESPSIDSLMIRFFEEIAMISQNKREEYLEEIKKLYKFFSKKI